MSVCQVRYRAYFAVFSTISFCQFAKKLTLPSVLQSSLFKYEIEVYGNSARTAKTALKDVNDQSLDN